MDMRVLDPPFSRFFPSGCTAAYLLFFFFSVIHRERTSSQVPIFKILLSLSTSQHLFHTANGQKRPNSGVQLLGFSLAFLGFIGTIACTAMVEWKASSNAGGNIVTAQAMYEGLWKSCVWQSTGQIQCKIYDSLLQLPSNIQGTRALMCAAIFLCFISMMVTVVGLECTTCMAEQPQQKSKVALAGGVIFIIAGVLALIGTSWYGHRVAQDFYSPSTPTNSRYEFGSALYVGWGAACLCIIGGGFLCCMCSDKGPSGKGPRYPPSSSAGGRDYV
ncbi:claudin-1-like [Poecilia latipinna]|uniref:claudin-1-like n=1 Tax=Poecilia latipinna TaxID=48699 RepID=UPI00072DCF46|nr:PREDICTED: claudin-1-like [Poecilia latipinna]